MKKFFKYFSLLLIVAMLLAGFIYKDRIALFFNVSKKYIDIKNNSESLKTSDSLNPSNSMDYKDIVYKGTGNNALKLDIYGSKKNTSKPSPVILYVHGGSWAYGDKNIPNAISPLLDSLREEGYTIISTSYELMKNKVNFEKQVTDVKDTIRWINKNKDTYNLDANNIGIVSTSAGAHLSLIASYTDDNQFKGEESLSTYSSKVNYIIDFFGPTDLKTLEMSKAGWDIQNALRGSKNEIDILMDKYSPINYVKGDLPSTLIIHGKNDNLVPYENATKLYDKCISNGTKSKLITLENSGHDLANISEEDVVKVAYEVLTFISSNSRN